MDKSQGRGVWGKHRGDRLPVVLGQDLSSNSSEISTLVSCVSLEEMRSPSGVGKALGISSSSSLFPSSAFGPLNALMKEITWFSRFASNHSDQ